LAAHVRIGKLAPRQTRDPRRPWPSRRGQAHRARAAGSSRGDHRRGRDGPPADVPAARAQTRECGV